MTQQFPYGPTWMCPCNQYGLVQVQILLSRDSLPTVNAGKIKLAPGLETEKWLEIFLPINQVCHNAEYVSIFAFPFAHFSGGVIVVR